MVSDHSRNGDDERARHDRLAEVSTIDVVGFWRMTWAWGVPVAQVHRELLKGGRFRCQEDYDCTTEEIFTTICNESVGIPSFSDIIYNISLFSLLYIVINRNEWKICFILGFHFF